MTDVGNAAEEVAAVIASRIASGEYPPGSKLPTIRELAEEREVSRSTASRAVLILEESMLVKTSPRQGTKVVDSWRHSGIRAWGLLLREPADNAEWLREWLIDANMLREMVTARVLGEVMRSGAPTVKEVVAPRLAKLEALVESGCTDHLALTQAEFDIVIELLHLTHHPALISLLQEAFFLVARTPRLLQLLSPEPRTMVQRWRALLALIDVVDPETAAAMLIPMIKVPSGEGLKIFDAWIGTAGEAGD